jgi:hypothetical protein
VGVGLAIGIPVAILEGHLVASQLFGVKSYDTLILSTTLPVLCGAPSLPHSCRTAQPAGPGTYAGAAKRMDRRYSMPEGSNPATIVAICP